MTDGIKFLDGHIPPKYLYDNPAGYVSIAPSVEQIRENVPWLAEQDSWLTWEWKDNGQKMPHRGDDPRKSTKWEYPENTVSLQEAWDAYQKHDHLAGIGFVFNGTEPEVLEDFDDCVNPWAFTVSDPCLEDALENTDEPAFFSTSGTGAHRYPVAANANDTDQHPHEVYIGDGGNNRWAAVTGWKITGDTHGPDRSEELNRLSDEYNEGAETVDMGNFDFDADPEEIDGEVTVPETVHDAFDGSVPACVAGLIHVLATHDPTDPDGPGWGQQTFMRYTHLLMLLAGHLKPETPEDLAELAGSFRSPAIKAAQQGKHPSKPPQSTRHGEGVPWDLAYQADMIRRKVGEGDLYPPSIERIEDRCNVRLGCDCEIHATARGSIGVLPVAEDPEIEDPPEPVDAENDYGMSLAEIREKDDKLDRLLASVYPVGYVDEDGDPDANKADWATAGKLWFWRFDEEQIKEIVRTHRPRGQSGAYLDRMVKNVCNGERYQPSLHTARRLASRNAYAVMGGGSDE